MSIESESRKRTLNSYQKKSSYAQKKGAIDRYHARFDDLKLRVPKGEREKWKEFAATRGTSLQQLIIGMMHQAMEKEGFDYSVEDGMNG